MSQLYRTPCVNPRRYHEMKDLTASNLAPLHCQLKSTGASGHTEPCGALVYGGIDKYFCTVGTMLTWETLPMDLILFIAQHRSSHPLDCVVRRPAIILTSPHLTAKMAIAIIVKRPHHSVHSQARADAGRQTAGPNRSAMTSGPPILSSRRKLTSNLGVSDAEYHPFSSK